MEWTNYYCWSELRIHVWQLGDLMGALKFKGFHEDFSKIVRRTEYGENSGN